MMEESTSDPSLDITETAVSTNGTGQPMIIPDICKDKASSECKELAIRLSRITPKNTNISYNVRKGEHLGSLRRVSSRGRTIALRQPVLYDSDSLSEYDSDVDEDFVPNKNCYTSDSDDNSDENPVYMKQVSTYLKNSLDAKLSGKTQEKCELDIILDEIRYYANLIGKDKHSIQLSSKSAVSVTILPVSGILTTITKLHNTPLVTGNSLRSPVTEDGEIKKLLKQTTSLQNTLYLVNSVPCYQISEHPSHSVKSEFDNSLELAIKKEDLTLLSQLFDDIIKAECSDQSVSAGFDRKDFPGASQLMTKLTHTKDSPATKTAVSTLHKKNASHEQIEKVVKYSPCLLCGCNLRVGKPYTDHMSNHLSQGTIPHCCGICSEVFWNGNSLKTHMQNRHNLKPFKISPACDFCSRRFVGKCEGTNISYQIHRVIDSGKTKEVAKLLRFQSRELKRKRWLMKFNQISKCSFCGISLEDWDKLVSHVRSAHPYQLGISMCHFCGRDFNDNEYKYNWMYEIHEYHSKFDQEITKSQSLECCLCKIECSDFYELSCHYLFHQSPEGMDCHICGHNCKEPVTFFGHITRHTGKGEFSCRFCDKSLHRPELLISHESTHPEAVNQSNFQCDICEAFLKNKHKLGWHRRRHFHPEFLCNKCGKQYYEYGQLQAHIRQSHGKGVICHICQKNTSNARGLKRHMKTHKKFEGKKCSKCGRSFRDQDDLDKHFDTIHLKTNPNLVCEYCGKGFIRKVTMGLHIARHHTNNKMFKCKKCDKAYYTSGGLVLHARTHTGERPYSCSHCSKAFASSTNLNDHIRIHTGEKPYHCPTCDKAFTKSCNMKTHVKLMHKKS